MTPYILLLIDVQSGIKTRYGSSCPWASCITDRLIANVSREILRARELGCPIIEVTVDRWDERDDWFGPTDDRLVNLLQDYDKHGRCQKPGSDDGAVSVINTCCQFGQIKRLRLVGGRATGCILALSEGLHRELPAAEIVVVKDAGSDFAQCFNWSEFDNIPGITLAEGGIEATQAS